LTTPTGVALLGVSSCSLNGLKFGGHLVLVSMTTREMSLLSMETKFWWMSLSSSKTKIAQTMAIYAEREDGCHDSVNCDDWKHGMAERWHAMSHCQRQATSAAVDETDAKMVALAGVMKSGMD